MGLFGKTFDFNEESKVSFEDGVFTFTVVGTPKYDKEQQITLLKEAGLDREELKAMPKAERDKLLEEKKLNPTDFTFDDEEE